jgi:hypothetical protein
MQPITAHPPACFNCGQKQPSILIYIPYWPHAQPPSRVNEVVHTTFTGGPHVATGTTFQASSSRSPAQTATPIPSASYASHATHLPLDHDCTCGPGCQCVGCITHPFNDATRNYVRSAHDAFEDFYQAYSPKSELGGASLLAGQTVADQASSPGQTLGADDYFYFDYTMPRIPGD